MRDLGTHEKHGRAIRAGCRAGSATDAGGGVHGLVGDGFWNGNGVGVGRGAAALADVAAGLNDAVEGAAVGDEVAHDRKGIGAKWLDRDGFAVLKLPHVELAGGAAAGAVWHAVDRERAGSADALAAIRIKLDRLDVFARESRVDDVEHFQERGIGGNVLGFVILERARGVGVFLAPDFEVEFHGADYL